MRRRRSLVGTMARTAVITGTAQATMGTVGRAMGPPPQAQAPAVAQQAVAPPQAPAAAQAGFGDDTIAKLKQLGELRESGVLNDAEFAAAKAKLLG